ncbi:MAG: 2-C-methyl-D-erythritol 2,4-cyclodiphosphate synthase [Treponemataceae bacterium]
MRIGLGYDLHALVENRKLIIGGIEIPFSKGCLAHSDGDVLLHAIIDALLGASALGDIGEMFPPSSDQWKNADSRTLLQLTWQRVKTDGWIIQNIDCVVVLEEPKFLPFRTKIQECIAKILEIDKSSIFVKAKTHEKLGDIGKGNAIEAHAVCLLSKP